MLQEGGKYKFAQKAENQPNQTPYSSLMHNRLQEHSAAIEQRGIQIYEQDGRQVHDPHHEVFGAQPTWRKQPGKLLHCCRQRDGLLRE